MSTNDEVDKIVQESGNNFHCRVTNYLRDNGWHTLVSPYYMDSSLNKPREIDLIAEKEFKYSDRLEQKHGSINIRLFIECKYIPYKIVFWFDDKDMESAKKWVTSNSSLPENNIYTDKHHYLATNSTVAKLFRGKTKRSQENEAIYKALNQCLNSMVSNR